MLNRWRARWAHARASRHAGSWFTEAHAGGVTVGADDRRVVASFLKRLRGAYTRTAHFDDLTSPLAEDPSGFTRWLREDPVAQAVRAPRGRAPLVPAPTDRPRRVLVLTWNNANFLHELLGLLEDEPRYDARFRQLNRVAELQAVGGKLVRIVEEVLAGGGEITDLVEQHLRADLEWADVVFVEWCTQVPVLLTLIDPRTCVVVRLHSYEAFTSWPHLVDWSRVDDLVFVSEHLRELTVATVPGVAAALEVSPGREPLGTHVVPLAMRLERFARPKAADARFTLGLVSWSAVAKDPLWALQVTRTLRAHDERYRLLLIGHPFDDTASPAAARYGEQLWPVLAELEEAGAVERRPQTDDVPAALEEVGVILSSSVREGCHTAVMEGAASGAVPVVRDWPFFARLKNGPRTLFPPAWVVTSPEEAAGRVLATTASAEVWEQAGRAAQDEAFARWDWAVVAPLYDRLLLGGDDVALPG